MSRTIADAVQSFIEALTKDIAKADEISPMPDQIQLGKIGAPDEKRHYTVANECGAVGKIFPYKLIVLEVAKQYLEHHGFDCTDPRLILDYAKFFDDSYQKVEVLTEDN